MLKVAGLSVALFITIIPSSLVADEFQDLVDGFGDIVTVAGIHHLTTANPDGTSINFWTNTSENAEATVSGLSNPHMAAADAYGNVFIADKSTRPPTGV